MGVGKGDAIQGIPDNPVVKTITLESGVITLKETTTPSAVTDYAKVYAKADNKLYFQDGAGTEHEISLVP
jgi:hypothetical protein